MNLLQRYRRLSLWNRLGTWGSIASILSIPLAMILTAASLLLPLWLARRISVPPTATTDLAAKHESPVKRPAPTITFVDGRRATVEFSVTTHIKEEDAATVVVTCGGADAARDSLDGKVLSSVIAQLEKRQLAEARLQRTEIEDELVASLLTIFKKVGLTLDYIALTEFTEVRSGVGR